ncbi:hypothetical protein GON03_22380 [Nocardioides sp. MAH-18]|uniref:Uncharacterized protein n=1 Tax=Nocardioides agri TaxID=2682843 RepID=A0A6L6XZ49_9ACTN|nr:MULTISPECIES: hypothetical protein [unclassified Nocardioides]MBA2952775.1 hypothetical protein [Nocardioides sp. CGMCC 1.13656]MVQ51937.1 hypothetical protein [Nocardioides sp. MAH-18]
MDWWGGHEKTPNPTSSVVALLTAGLAASAAERTDVLPAGSGRGPRHARRDPVGEQMLCVVACAVFDSGAIHRMAVGLGLADHASALLVAHGCDRAEALALGGWEGSRAGRLVAAARARRGAELRTLANDWLGRDADVVGGVSVLTQLSELTTEIALTRRPECHGADVAERLRRWGVRAAVDALAYPEDL